MKDEIGDRLVLHGKHGTRIGVVVEGDEGGGSRVRWADGGESAIYVITEANEDVQHETWNAAKDAPAVNWRRGVTAGVGHEASVAQEKLAKEAVAAPAPVAEVEPSTAHEAASGE